MNIDFEYLEELYDDMPRVGVIRKTQSTEDTEYSTPKKNKKNYKTARRLKYNESF